MSLCKRCQSVRISSEATLPVCLDCYAGGAMEALEKEDTE